MLAINISKSNLDAAGSAQHPTSLVADGWNVQPHRPPGHSTETHNIDRHDWY